MAEARAGLTMGELAVLAVKDGVCIDEDGQAWRFGVREVESGFEVFFKQEDNGDEVVKRYSLVEEFSKQMDNGEEVVVKRYSFGGARGCP